MRRTAYSSTNCSTALVGPFEQRFAVALPAAEIRNVSPGRTRPNASGPGSVRHPGTARPDQLVAETTSAQPRLFRANAAGDVIGRRTSKPAESPSSLPTSPPHCGKTRTRQSDAPRSVRASMNSIPFARRTRAVRYASAPRCESGRPACPTRLAISRDGSSVVFLRVPRRAPAASSWT